MAQQRAAGDSRRRSRLSAGVGTHEEWGNTKVGGCDDLRGHSWLAGGRRCAECRCLAIDSQLGIDEVRACGFHRALPACARVMVVVPLGVCLRSQRTVGCPGSLAHVALCCNFVRCVGGNGGVGCDGLVSGHARGFCGGGSSFFGTSARAACWWLVANSSSGSRVRRMRSNKPLVPTRTGEAPVLAAQRRR